MKKNEMLIWILLSAFLLRLLIHLIYTPWWVGDSYGYVKVIEAIISGDYSQYDGYRTPGFPFLIGLAWFLSHTPLMNHTVMAACPAVILTILQSILGLSAICLAWATLNYLKISETIQFYCVLALALLVPVAKFEMIISSESLSIFVISLSVYCLVRGFLSITKDSNVLKTGLLTGCICGLSVLVRPNNLVLYAMFFSVIFFSSLISLYRHEKTVFPVMRYIFISSVTGAIPLLLWMTFNFYHTGLFTLTPVISLGKTLTAYNLFDRVKPEDKLAGDIMQKYYGLENSGIRISRDYVWRAMPELIEKMPLMPLDHPKIKQQRVEIANYLGKLSGYLLKENKRVWFANARDNFAGTWQFFQPDFVDTPGLEKNNPVSPALTSVVKNTTGWTILSALNAFEASLFMLFYLSIFIAIPIYIKDCFSSMDEMDKRENILIFALAVSSVMCFIAPCIFAGFFPRYGVPFYEVLVVVTVALWSRLSSQKRSLHFSQ